MKPQRPDPIHGGSHGGYYRVPRDRSRRRLGVKKEGNQRASSRHDDKASAVAAARQFAENQRPSRVVVHKADGTIEKGHHFERGGADEAPTQGVLARLRGWHPF